MPDMPKMVRHAQIGQAFTPSTPIDDVDLFADRPDESMACIDAYFQKGRHIALYGERGVGKTSLANIIPAIVKRANVPNLRAERVDCNTQDTFNSIWRKLYRRLEIETPDAMHSGLESIDPEEIVFELERQNASQTLLVVDEFDRVEDDDALSLLADTVKAFSDHALPVTMMFVGVAESLTALLGEHESIIRSVEQVRMRRMSTSELSATLDRGFAAIDDLSLDNEARRRIIYTAEGLPHYAHALGYQSALSAVNDDRNEVTVDDVSTAEAGLIQTHSMVSDYRAATQSHQPGHLFEEVLLACAYAPRDSLGYFRPAEVREPLTAIVGRPMDIPNFQRHLNELSGDRRHALWKEGPERHYVYRFRDPLLQPYVKMMARATDRISDQIERDLAANQQAQSATSLLDPGATDPLF